MEQVEVIRSKNKIFIYINWLPAIFAFSSLISDQIPKLKALYSLIIPLIVMNLIFTYLYKKEYFQLQMMYFFAIIHGILNLMVTLLFPDIMNLFVVIFNIVLISFYQQYKATLVAMLSNMTAIVYLIIYHKENKLGIFTTDKFIPIAICIVFISILLMVQGKVSEKLKLTILNKNQQLSDYSEELSQTLDNLVQTQQQLIQSEKMAALGRLVSGVAHEINTPLGNGVTAISLQENIINEIIEKIKTNKVVRNDLENNMESLKELNLLSSRNLQKAASLINSFKKVSAEISPEEERTFNLKEYLEIIKQTLIHEIVEKCSSIQILCNENMKITTFPGVISQIITSLISNSLIHGFINNDRGSILIEAKEEQDFITLIYSDNGNGIDKDNIDKIFDPFFTTKRSNGLTGLGLHIVYNMVTQTLEGNIQCRSEIGNGTIFTIKIPNKN